MLKNLLKALLLSSSLYASYAKNAQVFTQCKNPGQVSLTFDDGPSYLYTPKLLDYLKKENIKATFFINGINYGDIENSRETQAIMRREIREGHDIGSHTFWHKSCFEAYEDGTLKENIERLEQGIKNIINLTPRFFRPPLGEGGFSKEYCEQISQEYDPRTEIIQGVLAGDGFKYGPDYGNYDYDIVLWNGDSEDWKCDGTTITSKDSINSLNYSMSPEKADPSKSSFIILIHDVHEYSVNNVVPEVVKHVRSLGYKFVPLSECIGRNPYKEARESYKEKIGDSDDGLDTDSFISSAAEAGAAYGNTNVAQGTTQIAGNNTAQAVDNNTAAQNNTTKIGNKSVSDDPVSGSFKLSVMTLSSILISMMAALYGLF